MSQNVAKIYISMPKVFLAEVDRTAEAEHLSRSGLIREALKIYMRLRERGSAPRLVQLAEDLRRGFVGVPEDELEERIDRAVSRVRARRERA